MSEQSEPSNSPPQVADLREAVEAKQAESRECLTVERNRLAGLETELAENLDQIAEHLGEVEPAASPDDASRQPNGATPDAETLAGQTRKLARIQAELAECQEHWLQQQERAAAAQASLCREFEATEGELLARREAVAALERETQRARAALAADAAALADAQRRLHESQQRLEQRENDLDDQELRTRRQRRRIAADLKARFDELRRDGDRGHENAGDERTGTATAADSALRKQLADLHRQRDALAEQLAAAESRAEAAEQVSDPEKLYELQRRFEMAVEDMRQYKHRVSELEEQLRLRPKADTSPSHGLDWESQKKRLLASLDPDAQGNPSKYSAEDRLTVEGAVRITDEVVAKRDAEIAELKRKLHEQYQRNAAHHAAPESKDFDAALAEERQRLVKLESELQDKLRSAEIELSVERAKLARQRAEIDEKTHALEKELMRFKASTPTEPGQPDPPAPVRGRWLARLGLKDIDGD